MPKKLEVEDVFFPTELSEDGSIEVEFDVLGKPCFIKMYPKDVMRMQKIMSSNMKVLRERVENA